jgi:elongation factor P hydroxylase
MSEEKNRPVKTLGPVWTGSGYVEVAVWAHAGEERVKHSVTFKRRYNAGGTWKDTQTLFDADLLCLARLLERAWEWIATQPAGQDRPARAAGS